MAGDQAAHRNAAQRWLDGGRVYGMTAVPGGRLFVGGSNGEVRIYDPRNGNPEWRLEPQRLSPEEVAAGGERQGHSDAVLSVTYNNLGVFTAGADLTIVQWDIDCFAFMRAYTGHKALISTLATFPSDTGMGLFSGSDDRTIKQWNTNNAKCMFTYKGHKAAVNCIFATQDGRWMYSGSKGDVKIWSINQRRCHKTIKAHQDAIWAVRVFQQENDQGVRKEFLATASSDATIKVWEDPVGKAEMVRLLRGHTGQVRDILVWKDIMFSCSKAGDVCVWDMREWQPIELLHGHSKAVTRMTLQNNQLCTCSFDRYIVRWDVTDILDRVGKQQVTQFIPYDPVKVAENRKKREEAQFGKYDEAKYYTRAKKRQLARMKPAEAVMQYDALPLNFIIDRMDYKCNASELLLDSIVFAPFLIMFVFFVIWDRSIEQSYFISRNQLDLFEANEILQQPWCTLSGPGGPWINPREGPRPTCDPEAGLLKIFKRFEDIASAADFIDWVMGVYTPTMWKGVGHGYGPAGEPDGPPLRNPPLQGATYLVGALRVRTHRVQNTTCSFNNEFFSPDITLEQQNRYEACYGHWTSSDGEKSPYACLSAVQDCPNLPSYGNGTFSRARDFEKYRGVKPEWAQQWVYEDGFRFFEAEEVGGGSFQSVEVRDGSWPPGGYVIEVPFVTSPNDAMDMLAAVFDNGFVDDLATRFVVLEWFSYSAYVNTFTKSTFFAEVAPGGQWITEAKYYHFRVWTENMISKTIFDIFFLFFVLYYWRKFILDWIAEFKSSRSVAKFIFDPWNLLELTNMLCFIIVYAYRARWWIFSAANGHVAKQPNDATGYPKDLDPLLDDFLSQQIINSVNVVLTFLKILKFFRLNERLNILTRTLDLAAQSIIGVLVLFIWIVFGYSMTGNTIFGGGIFEFRGIGVSFSTLMRFLVGDFDYATLRDENQNMAWVFFWSYQVLGMFILLNFIIAVLGDAFSDISQGSSHQDLDVTLQKTFSDAKDGCMPSALKRRMVLYRHRKTQTGLLRQVLEEIKINVRNPMLTEEQIEEQGHRDLLSNVFIHKEEYMGGISEHLKDDLSEDFLLRVWLDMAWEYHKDQCMGAVLEELRKKQLIEDNIGSQIGVLADCMTEVQDIRCRFDDLEAKLRPIVQSWQIKKKN
eukprot:Hpha_TRINITY_DN14116_c0_g2::TRINITY_DN14116_c0_g2_i1::g.10605::m.10605